MSRPHADQAIAGFDQVVGDYSEWDAVPALLRLLAGGRPVEGSRIAEATGRDVDTLVAGLPGAQWDEQGRLIGFGLTIVPTPHRFRVEGQDLFTWCATDALLFTLVLGRPAVVDSTCPATGAAIHVELASDGVGLVSPAETVVSADLPTCAVADIRTECCAHGHFFASLDAAGWRAEHPSGTVRSVADEFAVARRLAESLGWIDGAPA